MPSLLKRSSVRRSDFGSQASPEAVRDEEVMARIGKAFTVLNEDLTWRHGAHLAAKAEQFEHPLRRTTTLLTVSSPLRLPIYNKINMILLIDLTGLRRWYL